MMSEIKFPLPVSLMPHEQFNDSGLLPEGPYWLTSHRLIVKTSQILIVPLSAIGAIRLTRRTFPGRRVGGLVLAVLAVGLGVASRQLGNFPVLLLPAAVVVGAIALILLVSSRSYRILQIDGMSGTPLFTSRAKGWQNAKPEALAAVISNAMIRLAPSPVASGQDEALEKVAPN